MTKEGGSQWPGGAEERYPILAAIVRKCEPHVTGYDITESPGGSAVLELFVLVEDGRRGGYHTYIQDGRRAQMALQAPFERYKKFTLKDHRAIFSPALREVECEVELCEAFGRWDSASSRQKDEAARRTLSALGLRSDPATASDLEQGKLDPSVFDDKASYRKARAERIFKRSEARKKDLEERELDPHSRVTLETEGEASVSVGPCSDTWKVWQGSMEGPGEDDDPSMIRRYLTLRVEGVEISDEDSAADVLEHLGNAALFELDRASGVGLTLSRRLSGLFMRRRDVEPSPELPSWLTVEYDREALSLYWYARSASEMPLLSFLGFYQVLEFYFPQYSRRDALQAVKESLRGLSFETLRDADVAKVLEAVRVGRKGSFGNEIEQLKATLRHGVDQETLRRFFEANEERKDFYTSDKCTLISPTRIPVNRPSEDWRGDVARRVYEIRNRVVHAKSQHEDLDVLLPYDPEAALLWHDVELVSFLAREVLSSSARPLQTPEK